MSKSIIQSLRKKRREIQVGHIIPAGRIHLETNHVICLGPKPWDPTKQRVLYLRKNGEFESSRRYDM